LKHSPMAFELYCEMALARDLRKYRLRRGDLVRLFEYHVSPKSRVGYLAEVLGAMGQALAVIEVASTSLKPLQGDEVLSVRAK
jgi:hypothetical protein